MYKHAPYLFNNGCYNNRDKINSNIKNIDRHCLHIKKLINMLTLRLNVNHSSIIRDFEPFTNANPQNRPYGMTKSTLQKLYSLPKYLINKPTIERENGVIVFSFPVVSFTPNVSGDKQTIINSLSQTNGINHLTLFQLNIVYKTNSQRYSINLHQNCFEKGVRQPIFLGRIELGDTHNTHHERVQSTFHIHEPFDKNIDLKFQSTILSAIYHCQPEVYSNQQNTSIESAIDIAMRKFNIQNCLGDAVDLKNHRVDKFLESSCGKEWSENLLLEPKQTLSFSRIWDFLQMNESIKPKNDIADYILNKI